MPNTSIACCEIQTNHDLYNQGLTLRYELFFKEHNLPFEILLDDKEQQSSHVAISMDQTLIAYGRLSPMDNGDFQISQMLVNPKFQSQGYGSQLLRKLIKMAQSKGANIISLNARLSALPLYQKHNFRPLGAEFTSASTGVIHQKMQLVLPT